MKAFAKLVRRDKAERMGLRFWLSVVLLSVTLAVVFMVARENITLLKQNKEKDVWAIVYLEIEKISRDIFDRLPTKLSALSQDSRVHAVYSIDRAGKQLTWESGGEARALAFEDLGFASLSELRRKLQEKHLVKMDGRNYLLSYAGRKIHLVSVESASWLKTFAAPIGNMTIYLLNRNGQLVASSEDSMRAVDQRQLVQKFILNPLSEGQMRYKSDGDDYVGFFREIPHSNLVLFAESSLALMQDEIWQIYRPLLVYSGFVVLFGLLLIQWPLSKILAPLAELKKLTEQVASGDFYLTSSPKAMGELGDLAEAFSAMGKALVTRDEQIKVHLEEEKQAIRLKNELAITSNIQQNFLPERFDQSEQSGIELAARYLPADEAAGDWYQYYYDEARQETIVALADVSGHGAGAAMFTAIIAGSFAQAKRHRDDSFPATKLLANINALFWELGKGKWHATMLVLVFRPQDRTVAIYNAGHQKPMMFQQGRKPSTIKAGGDILGIAPQVTHQAETVALSEEQYLLAYTDGLVESRNPEGRVFNARSIRKTLTATMGSDAEVVAETLHNDWRHFIDGNAPEDDTCFVAMRVLAA